VSEQPSGTCRHGALDGFCPVAYTVRGSLPRRDAVDPGLLHNGEQRVLRAAPGLQMEGKYVPGATITAFRTRPLTGEHRYHWVDATYHKVRVDGRVTNQAIVVAVDHE